VAVQFVFGRAGSGKTHRCLQEAKRHLKHDAAGGPTLLLLVPEQATLQIERMLLADADLPGMTRCHVLSFRRLQHLVLSETGFADREMIGPIGRQMVIQHLLSRHRRRLKLLGKVADRPGTAAKVAGGLVELMQQGVVPEQLEDVAARLAGPDASAPQAATPGIRNELLASKLHDLAVIYKQYLAWLAEGRADPAGLLAEAAERLGPCKWLHGAILWVDGFAGFTVQQRYMLGRLAQIAGHVEISLLIDAETAGAAEPPEPHALFFRTFETYQRLEQTFREMKVPIAEPVLLRDEPPPRFQDSPVLAHLERQLFRTTRPLMLESHEPPQIEILEAPNRRVEVEAVARRIVDLTRVTPARQALRYRDIGVVVRDLEPYHDLVRTIFASHGIPCFIDRRRSISHHPLVELVRALLRLLTEDWPIDGVAALLKTHLVPVPADRADLLENYLLAHGIAGWAIWSGQEWRYLRRLLGSEEEPAEPSEQEEQRLAKVNRPRRILVQRLADWAALAGQRRTGRDWADSLYMTLEQLKVPQRLQRWQKRAESAGEPMRLEQSQEHIRVWSQWTQLLDDFVSGLGEEELTPEQLRRTIEAGLEAFSLPLVPPAVDQVVVGSVERSRQPNLAAVFVLGFNEGLFPPKPSEDPLLSDGERLSIGQLDGRIELATSRQSLFDERLLAYIAVTRPSRYLWISYACSDQSGKRLAPSPYLRAIEAALPNVAKRSLADPAAEPQVANVATPWQAAAGLVLAGRSMAERASTALSEGSRRSWAALWQWAQGQEPIRQKIDRVASALEYDNSAAIQQLQAEKLFGCPLRCSVSQFQEFATCPYRHFATYGLRLRERDQFDLAAVELGSFYHRVLYMLGRKLRRQGLSLRTVDEESLSALVRETTDEELAKIADEFAQLEAHQEWLLRRTENDVGRAMRGHAALWRKSRLEPIALEAAFGLPDGALPPLTIKTPKGRTVLLRGKIDRIDRAVVGRRVLLAVIDYKRSSRYKLRLGDILCGLQLQLIVYLKVALEAAAAGKLGPQADEPIPAGMFYFNILPEWQKVDPAAFAAETDTHNLRSWQLQGLVNKDEETLAAFNEDFAADQARDAHTDQPWPIKISLTSRGRVDARSQAATGEQFDRLIRRVWTDLGKLADAILDGVIEVKPYRAGSETPCAYCPYVAVCRFDPRINGFRPVDTSVRISKLHEILNA